jgi:cysteinyl-tRNA synthetase
MSIRLYNTLTRAKDDFIPIEPGKVRLYTCGPTVYNYAHIGNLRTYVFEDVLKRVLTVGGFKVTHVMNVTDVGHLTSDADVGEDKMEKGAAREGKSVWEIADFYWQAFRRDMARLNLIEPTVWCKATDHIAEQIAMVRALEEKGFTYVIEDGVYFDTSRLGDYGKLARLDVKGLQAGARVEMVRGKRNATDFALWKFSPKDAHRLMEWPSPWGVGFPGWHIECSAMALKYLGERVDIHCGGVDHIAVHHTNEIAQTEAALGHPWVNWWLHAEFLVIPKGPDGESEKMAKSSGEFLKLDVLVEKGYDPLAYRLFCFTAHYRQQLAFSWEGMNAAASALNRLKKAVMELRLEYRGNEKPIESRSKQFFDAVSDDLNMPKAMAAVWGTLAYPEGSSGEVLATLLEMDKVLGLGLNAVEEREDTRREEEIVRLIEKYQGAIALKQFEVAAELMGRISDNALTTNIENVLKRFAARGSSNTSASFIDELVSVLNQKLGLTLTTTDVLDTAPKVIENLIEQRNQARKTKDFAKADRIRKLLKQMGFEIKDTPQGTTLHKL